MLHFRKRKLHDEAAKVDYWIQQPVAKRLEAIETIRATSEEIYAQQAFPRVYRITRKKRS